MRLDHLLSKIIVRYVLCVYFIGIVLGYKFKALKKFKSFCNLSGGDTFEGNTRSHPEHDG